MSFIIGAAGFIIGLFLWSSIYGSLFGTYPIEKRMLKNGIIKKIDWTKTIGAIAIASVVLFLTAIFAPTFFYGTLPAAVVMLFNIGKLKNEAYDNFQADFARKQDDQKKVI